MSSDGVYQNYMQYISDIVAKYEKNFENKYLDVREDLCTLSDKINDKNLYLGVVGAFSSGKSTFINSVIHKNLLPTDAVQGTTVAASILKKSDKDDVEIVLNDGTIFRYSDDQDGMLARYHVEKPEPILKEKERKSFWEKLIIWIKKIFGLYEEISEPEEVDDVDLCVELFKKIISTEELASDLKYVTLYYKNANIPHSIAMVDTPGTESLNKRHNMVTKNAIDNVCDAIVVIIPYDEPVSEELLNYVNANLGARKDDCIFVVTKIELLGDLDELPQLLRVIKRRLENGLSIKNAQVIPMPTLIYLKSVDETMTTTFLNNISDDEKNHFIEMYEAGINDISNTLENNRNRYITNKIVSVCERVAEKINANLSEVVDDYGRKEQKLKRELVTPLNQFKQNSRNCIDEIFKAVSQQLNGGVSAVQLHYAQFSSTVEKTISECSSSSDLITELDFSCAKLLKEINTDFVKNATNAKNDFNEQLIQIQKEFDDLYSKCGINSNYSSITVNDAWIIEESFISECEDLLQEELDSIKINIRNDTDGLFNKFKSIFSNPFSKHKEQSLNRLLKIIDNLCQKTKEYSFQRLRDISSKYKQMALNSIEKMADNNASDIENYIRNTQSEIEANVKGRQDTEKDIEELEEYIHRLKEGK